MLASGTARASANSGEPTRLACWFWRPAKTNVLESDSLATIARLQKDRDRQDALARARDARAPRSSARNTTGSALTTSDYVEKNRAALRGPGRAKRWDGTRTGGELSA